MVLGRQANNTLKFLEILFKEVFMRCTEISPLVIKFLKELGFALFTKRAKIKLKNEMSEFSKDILLEDQKEILSWNLLNPCENELILHIGLIEESGKRYFCVASSSEDILYTKKVSIRDLQNKSAYLLGLVSV
jgi:hypothetical protein